ncbi:MAG: RHS repeat-associated core domain-containing protein [Planctomycetota bacterium]|nr:RHS repeat-associated core domain-containing protein [Planctomycetota bacterium]
MIARYEYDALNRRAKVFINTDTDDDFDEFRHFYYNAGWQILETRLSTSENTEPQTLQPEYQYVWSLRYMDAPVLRDKNTDSDDLCDDERLYYANDANMNVTALLATDGTPLERYVYDPYGKMTIYDDDWSETRGTSSYDNNILFCGYYRDNETGLYHVRNRYYHPYFGWITRDPAGYADGMSLYEYCRSRATIALDPLGLVDVGTTATVVIAANPEAAVVVGIVGTGVILTEAAILQAHRTSSSVAEQAALRDIHIGLMAAKADKVAITARTLPLYVSAGTLAIAQHALARMMDTPRQIGNIGHGGEWQYSPGRPDPSGSPDMPPGALKAASTIAKVVVGGGLVSWGINELIGNDPEQPADTYKDYAREEKYDYEKKYEYNYSWRHWPDDDGPGDVVRGGKTAQERQARQREEELRRRREGPPQEGLPPKGPAQDDGSSNLPWKQQGAGNPPPAEVETPVGPEVPASTAKECPENNPYYE